MNSATNIEAADSVMTRAWNGSKVLLFGGVLGGVLTLDLVTKLLIQRSFTLYQQVQVIGDYVRLTYIYNPGAAFGIHLGEYSRFIFLFLSLLALFALAGMYWVTSKSRISSYRPDQVSFGTSSCTRTTSTSS